jgi:hypothetical protein
VSQMPQIIDSALSTVDCPASPSADSLLNACCLLLIDCEHL